MRPELSAACLLALALVAGVGLAPTGSAADDPEPIVLFEDQRTSGTIVLVDLVQLPAGGFVVLHEPMENGTGLGPTAGASTLLSAGLHQHVPVVLFDDVDASRTLVAALYEDSNHNQALDLGDGHEHHGHDHEGQDHLYTDGDLPIGDEAHVEPHDHEQAQQTSVDPLLVGAATAVAALALWAVRYR